MRRRQFITLLGATAAAWPLAARAQQAKLPVVGTLYGVSAAEWTANMSGFRRGLGETGFVEGRSLAIESRWADGHYERMPALAADLIGRKVAAILVGGNAPGVRAAMAATHSIPIVFTTGSDPAAAGLVASLNRPGGNATGVTFLGSELIPKRLELLREVMPGATKFAVLLNPTNAVTSQQGTHGSRTAARRLGLDVIVVNAGSEAQIETAFADAVQQRAAALVASDAFFSSRREQIAALGLRYALPTMTDDNASVAAGTLISYSASIPDSYRQAGVYVGRILKGEKAGDLPIMQPTKFGLAINLKTAKALGLTIPPSLLAIADEVIE